MRISEMLKAIASWLESPDNEAILLSEYDDECLNVVAHSCVEAAHALKIAAAKVDEIEPYEPSTINADSLEGLANLASALDSSGDIELQKQAAVIDEILLTIAADPNAIAEKKAANEKKIDEIRKLYLEPKKSLEDTNKIADARKAIENSPMSKQYRVLESPLSTRTCVNHPGAGLQRIAEGVYKCELGGEIFDYNEGYKLNNGASVPGSSVANQTDNFSTNEQALFDTREGRLATNVP